MSTVDVIREQMEAGTSTIQIIKDMYQAFNLSEVTTKQIIANIINEVGDCVPYKGESDLFYVEQEKPDGGISLSCPPELKANNHKKVFTGWVSSIMEHRALYTRVIENCNLMLKVNNTCNHLHGSYGACEAADQTPESFMHQVFIDYTNENTNRLC